MLHLLAFAIWIGGAVWNIFAAVLGGRVAPTASMIRAAGGQGVLGHLILGNLERMMLCNTTGPEFVASDHSTDLDNPRCKRQTGMGPTRLAQRGLQIHCLLGLPRHLFLYNSLMYLIKSNSFLLVLIKSNSSWTR